MHNWIAGNDAKNMFRISASPPLFLVFRDWAKAILKV